MGQQLRNICGIESGCVDSTQSELKPAGSSGEILPLPLPSREQLMLSLYLDGKFIHSLK